MENIKINNNIIFLTICNKNNQARPPRVMSDVPGSKLDSQPGLRPGRSGA